MLLLLLSRYFSSYPNVDIPTTVGQNMDETILYLNARNEEMEKLAEKYTKPPYNVKLMGDSHNYGIAQALNWMFGNASNEHVLLLEKDFRLVESGDCAMEQLQTGLDLLEVRRGNLNTSTPQHVNTSTNRPIFGSCLRGCLRSMVFHLAHEFPQTRLHALYVSICQLLSGMLLFLPTREFSDFCVW